MLPAGPTRKSDTNYCEIHVRSTAPFSLPLALYQPGLCSGWHTRVSSKPQKGNGRQAAHHLAHTGGEIPHFLSLQWLSRLLTFTFARANFKSQDMRENCSGRCCTLMFCIQFGSRFCPGCTGSISAASQQAALLWLRVILSNSLSHCFEANWKGLWT